MSASSGTLGNGVVPGHAHRHALLGLELPRHPRPGQRQLPAGRRDAVRRRHAAGQRLLADRPHLRLRRPAAGVPRTCSTSSTTTAPAPTRSLYAPSSQVQPMVTSMSAVSPNPTMSPVGQPGGHVQRADRPEHARRERPDVDLERRAEPDPVRLGGHASAWSRARPTRSAGCRRSTNRRWRLYRSRSTRRASRSLG